MVKGIEDLRTPLSTILHLDQQLRGTLSGFMMPAFVIDLPGGGGKRLVNTYDSYDPHTGIATYRAPGLPGAKGRTTYTYYDPQSDNDSLAEELRSEQMPRRELWLQEPVRPTVPQQGPHPDLYRRPAFIQHPGPKSMPATTNTQPMAVKTNDLTSHHIGINSCEQSASATAP